MEIAVAKARDRDRVLFMKISIVFLQDFVSRQIEGKINQARSKNAHVWGEKQQLGVGEFQPMHKWVETFLKLNSTGDPWHV